MSGSSAASLRVPLDPQSAHDRTARFGPKPGACGEFERLVPRRARLGARFRTQPAGESGRTPRPLSCPPWWRGRFRRDAAARVWPYGATWDGILRSRADLSFFVDRLITLRRGGRGSGLGLCQGVDVHMSVGPAPAALLVNLCLALFNPAWHFGLL